MPPVNVSDDNNSSIKDRILDLGTPAHEASRELSPFDSDHKNRILRAMAGEFDSLSNLSEASSSAAVALPSCIWFSEVS